MTTLITTSNYYKFEEGDYKSFSCAILPTIKNAYLLIEDNLIADFGSMEIYPIKADNVIDATEKSSCQLGVTVIHI
jgi:imidazolonepropionase-like amidohydrolase